MTLFFFGADKPWKVLQEYGFRRRNTWMLKAFYDSNAFPKIYVVFKTTRVKAFKALFILKRSAIKDIFIASILPEFIAIGLLKNINYYLFKLQLRLQGVVNINDSNSIIWCYQQKGYQDAKSLNLKGRYFFDTDHNIIDDINLEPKRREIQKKAILRAAMDCELVISSARSMLMWYKNQGFNNILRIRNGVCLERFINIKKSKNKKITIGYLGTLSKWIDYELFENLVKSKKNFYFIIIGDSYKSDGIKIFEKYSNVVFVGNKAASEIPQLLGEFDIALNLYKNDDWLDVDSMKIYEYMAAGIPVVTSNFHDYLEEDFDKLLYIGRNLEEIESHINYLIENPLKNEYAYDFLKKNSWSERVKYFLKQIEN